MTRRALLHFAFAASLALHSGAHAQQQPPPQQPPTQTPCATRPEYRQLDFWAGEWEVTAGGRTVASSTIERIVGDCIIFENYTQPDAYHGKSFSFYDAALGKWRQTWVDSAGGASEFVGVFRDGAMRFEGETHLADGRRVLRRMTLYDLGSGRVRQSSERSLDGGKTWAVAYDFTYLRKK